MIRSFGVLMLLAASADAQKQVAWWGGEWEAAFLEARRRNVPVILGFVQDHEEANDRIANGLYTDPQFIKAAAQSVPIIACMTVHAAKAQETRRGKESVCSRFGAIPCEAHKSLETYARPAIFGESDVTTPHHVVLLPDKTVVSRIQDVAATGSYVDALQQAQKKLGLGLTADAYQDALSALSRAKKAYSKREIGDALAALVEFDKAARGAPMAKEGQVIRDGILGLGQTEVAKAQELAGEGRHIEALRTLGDALKSFKGSDVWGSLKEADTKMRATKEGRSAAVLLAREEKQRPAFEKARAFETEKDFARAAKEYAKVAGLADGTPLAALARERLQAFRSDQDIAPLVLTHLEELDANDVLKSAEEAAAKGDKAKSTELYRSIVSKWPKSGAAARAAKALGGGN